MAKDFDTWNGQKKQIQENESYLPLYSEREIRWCRLGINVGFEQDGTGNGFSRPVLIMKGFSRRVCLIVPLTTSQKKNRYLIPLGTIGDEEAQAIISQLRLIDTRRLDTRIETLDMSRFEQLRKAVKDIRGGA